MSRYLGKLERRDLGPGVWILVTPHASWVLRGTVPPELRGKQVEVEGEPEEAFGFEMAGPALRLQSIRAV